MPAKVKDLVEAAHKVVPGIAPQEAQKMMEEGALLLDVRDSTELVATGTAVGAHHVPRGMLEFRADPDSPLHDHELRPDRPVVLYCAAGGRAALAGQTLKEMGYAQVYNLGGFKDWQAAGGPVTGPLDPGM
ncbi:MAG: rhodanese-like domain-containing protein [Paracoccaceae bacterium]|jgi:rhodanese-related sulfurtransferase|nr:rhodanese-like domain-containing protein [Paracoccaceae bacterium]